MLEFANFQYQALEGVHGLMLGLAAIRNTANLRNSVNPHTSDVNLNPSTAQNGRFAHPVWTQGRSYWPIVLDDEQVPIKLWLYV